MHALGVPRCQHARDHAYGGVPGQYPVYTSPGTNNEAVATSDETPLLGNGNQHYLRPHGIIDILGPFSDQY